MVITETRIRLGTFRLSDEDDASWLPVKSPTVVFMLRLAWRAVRLRRFDAHLRFFASVVTTEGHIL